MHLLSYKAFTLAEVLITLGIIGVVAALTIPTLMNQTNNAEMVTGLKKAYSSLSQATQLAVMENGDSVNWDRNNIDVDCVNLIYSYLKPHLQIAKDCENNKTGCWAPTKNLNNVNSSYTLPYGFGANALRIFSLSDGMNVVLNVWGNYGELGVNDSDVVSFAVDVNGDKKPNTLGKDVFFFVLTNNKLVPAGNDNDSALCVKNGNDISGIDCAAKVLREGAINY